VRVWCFCSKFKQPSFGGRAPAGPKQVKVVSLVYMFLVLSSFICRPCLSICISTHACRSLPFSLPPSRISPLPNSSLLPSFPPSNPPCLPPYLPPPPVPAPFTSPPLPHAFFLSSYPFVCLQFGELEVSEMGIGTWSWYAVFLFLASLCVSVCLFSAPFVSLQCLCVSPFLYHYAPLCIRLFICTISVGPYKYSRNAIGASQPLCTHNIMYIDISRPRNVVYPQYYAVATQ